MEKPGDYLVEGAWSFSAKPVAKDGLVYTPRGFTVETFENGAWSAPVFHEGTNYVYDTATSTVPVRLSWKWRSYGFMINFR